MKCKKGEKGKRIEDRGKGKEEREYMNIDLPRRAQARRDIE